MDYNCGVYFPKTGKSYVSYVDPADETWLERHLQHSEGVDTSGNSSDWTEFNTAANRRPLPQNIFSAGARSSESPPLSLDRRNVPPDKSYSTIGPRRPHHHQRSFTESRELHVGASRNVPKSLSQGMGQPANFVPGASNSGARRFSSAAQDKMLPSNQRRFPPSMASSFPAPCGNRTRLPESLFSTLPDQVPAKTKPSTKPLSTSGRSSDRDSTPTLDRASRRAILENVFLGQPLQSSAFVPPSPPSSPGKKSKLKIRFPTQRQPSALASKHQKQQQIQHQINQQQKEKAKKLQPQKKPGNGFTPKPTGDVGRVSKRPRQSLFAKVCFHCGTTTKMAGSNARISSPLTLVGNRDSRGSSNWSRLDLETYGFDGIYGDIESQGELEVCLTLKLHEKSHDCHVRLNTRGSLLNCIRTCLSTPKGLF